VEIEIMNCTPLATVFCLLAASCALGPSAEATGSDGARLALHKPANQWMSQGATNRISVYGHTSASANGAKPETDWALSSARADSSRRVLQGAGVEGDRVYQVSGKAGSEPLYPDDPTLPGNRRIAIVLLREAPVLPPNPGL
jgi:flagellar motor protein MotB